MALTLIVYPQVDYNSYVSLIDADDILDFHTEHSVWVGLSDDDKMRYLSKAFKEIVSIPGFTEPLWSIPEDPGCLPEAQAYLALQYLVVQRALDNSKIKSEKVGPMSTVYSDNDSSIPQLLTPEILRCLDQFGTVVTFDAFAVGSIRKVR